MIWNIFEYAATFVEYMIYADFMLKFLKPKKKQMALLCYLLILGINTALTLTFNHFISGYMRFTNKFYDVKIIRMDIE